MKLLKVFPDFEARRWLALGLGIALLLLMPACSGPSLSPQSSPALSGEALFRRVAERYAKAEHYSDEGLAVVDSSRTPDSVRFQTSFARSEGLSFSFWPERPVTDGQARSTILANATGRASTRLSTDALDASQEMSLLDATTRFQGVSRLASLFVPRLLFGLAVCSCASAPELVVAHESDVSTGMRSILIRASDEAQFLFTIDPQDMIRQIAVVRDTEDRVVRLTITYDKVSLW